MKKVLFLLFLVFSFVIYSATFSVSDEKEILKQFSDFQKAVKKKDAAAISKYISYPLKDGNTKEVIWKNSSDLAKDIKDKETYTFYSIDELKADSNSGKIINLEERLLVKNGEFGDEFLSVTGRFLDTNDVEGTIYEGINKPHFVVVVSVYDDMFEGGTYYLFSFENKKLELVSLFRLP